MVNVKNYKLDEMIAAVQDRLADYEEHAQVYEETYAGEKTKSKREIYYDYGYGDRLEDTIQLLKELR